MPLNCSASNLPSWAISLVKRLRPLSVRANAFGWAPTKPLSVRLSSASSAESRGKKDRAMISSNASAQREKNAALREVEPLQLAVLIESFRRVHFDVGQQCHQ